MSSLFVSNPCNFEGDTIVNFLSWSNSDSIAALASNTIDENDRETNQVLIMNNEGELIKDNVITHSAAVTAFEWQPNGKILAVGWADATLSCWICDGKSKPTSTFSNSHQHGESISIVKWNPMGKRLVSGDKRGLVCVWSADVRGNLTPMRQYRKNGEITTVAFYTLPLRSEILRKAELKQTYSPPFFFGTSRGSVVYADDLGHCTDLQKLPSSIDIMLFFDEKFRLIIITRSLMLTQYQVADDGKVSRLSQTKLSIMSDSMDKGLKYVVWANPGLLAMASQEKMIRFFDIATEESYNLSLSSLAEIERNDRVVCVAFGALDRYIAAGTQQGVVAIWSYVGPIRDLGSRTNLVSSSPSDWEFQYKINLRSPILQLEWHGGRGTLGVVTEDNSVVLSEVIMQGGLCGDLAVLQRTSTEVSVLIGGVLHSNDENTGMTVKGLSVAHSCFVVWSGKSARVYRVDLSLHSIDALNAFPTNGIDIVIADTTSLVDEALFIAEGRAVKITNFTGHEKQRVSFTENEGIPRHLDINDKFLAIATDIGIVKILDVSSPSKPPKALGSAGRFIDIATSLPPGKPNPNAPMTLGNLLMKQFQEANPVFDMPTTMSHIMIRDIKLNCDGTRVAILADYVEGSLEVHHHDTRLHIYDRNKGGVNVYDFGESRRCPIRIAWDDSDDRILCCETKRIRGVTPAASVESSQGKLSSSMNMETSVSSTSPSKGAGSEPESDYDVEVVIFFVTTEHGLLMQDSFTKKFPLGNLLGIGVPRIFFQNAPNIQRTFENDALVDVNAKPRISSKLMRDFVGMDDIESNPNVKVALLDFSFFLTLGKLDEAYRCIKAIDSPSVWENMAQMCIKTKRLDVAEVCLGNMGHARGAAALRASRVENSVDVSVGILAIQLGFNDDAVKLFRETKRYDLLNKLYQAVGDWGKAIQVATNYDRVHLKTTHHNYAKHLESIGDIDLAIEHFELAETARHEVPRMLFNNGKIEELEHYVNRSKDEQLLKWWAQYMESNEYFDKACKYYRRGGDFLSLVRIACFKEDFNQASEIIQESGDRSAAYHFARQLEIQGDYHSAINFFADAGCYNHSIRLAKAYGLDAELMRFALESTPSLMIDCAIYFEERNEFEKAIQLYRKGGDLPRALDLCFRAGENNPSKSKAYYEMLNAIAQDLGADTSPQTLARCGEFLVNHKQFDKAVELFVMAKRYTQAIDMCMQHRVNITDEMVKMLTPNTDNMDPAEKKEIYQELGKALKKQGSYTLASKMYTQAGDRIRGIKCLVRSGDTKAVIKFAQVSRNAEIYTLAANYLQQMNWRESVDIMKAIIQFYTKANAFEQLAGFYDSCAQVEIDDYRDYEKAIGALKEALKYLNRAGTKSAADMSDMIEKRIGMIEKFVTAKKLMKRDPKAMVAMCEELLQEPMLEEAIRSGDCLAMLVEYFHDSGNFAEAHHYIEEMEARRIPLHPYVDAEVIEAVVKATGGPKGQSKKSKNSGGSKPTGGPSSGVARVGLADSKTDDDVIDEVDEPKQDIKANVGLGDTFGTTDSQQSQGMLARDEDELDEDLDELEEDFEPEPSPVKNKRAPLMTNVTLGGRK